MEELIRLAKLEGWHTLPIDDLRYRILAELEKEPECCKPEPKVEAEPEKKPIKKPARKKRVLKKK